VRGRAAAGLGGAALAGALTLLGCGSAVRVFLDLPQRARAAPVAFDSLSVAERRASVAVFEPAPIEAVTDVDSALALLPRDHAGGIDWVAAERTGTIRPRSSRQGPLPDSMGGFSYDFYVWDGDGPEAFFPHSTHSKWLSCQTCHPSVYRYRREGRPGINPHGPESCGRCHGSIAFRIQACERCHDQAELPPARQEPQRSSTIWFRRDSASLAQSAVGVGEGSYPSAFFPHFEHRIRYRCKACHVEAFPLDTVSAAMTLTEAHESQKCGGCHNGGQAFAIDPNACERCHVTSAEAAAARDSVARRVDEPDLEAGRRNPQGPRPRLRGADGTADPGGGPAR